MSKYDFAKLRAVPVQLTLYRNEPHFIFQDALGLSPETYIPERLRTILIACNGSNTVQAMCQIYQLNHNEQIPEAEVEHWLNCLDKAYLLENDQTDTVRKKAIAEFRAQPYRLPTIAGRGYAAEPQALRRELQDYIDKAPKTDQLSEGVGLISPHIDYYRGGPVYAQVWQRMAKLARQAECVIILGTDHHSPTPGQMTLTRQDYATPFGVLPTDQSVVDALVDELGEDDLFVDELHHRIEWSIELPAVWLHFIRDGQPCPIVPILCGSIDHFGFNDQKPADDDRLNTFIDTLKKATAGKQVLVVASGDLAHLGPAFDGAPIDKPGFTRIKIDDDRLLAPIFAGDADGFYDVIRQDKASRNVCGTSPFYLAMKIMGNVQGEFVSYDRCPADYQSTSFVSVCGVTFK